MIWLIVTILTAYVFCVWFYIHLRYWCPWCQRYHNQLPQRRRMNTQFGDEEMNWLDSCEPFFLEQEDYWAERWAEYWSSVL